MATRAKKKTTKKKTARKAAPKAATKKKVSAKKRAPAKAKEVARKPAPKKSTAVATRKGMSPKAANAVKAAADALWGVGDPKPHTLLQELHEVLLLRCLEEAEGNYAAAAALFGPSRQSVQQYANSPLRDSRWKPFQQNRRRR
ncbi:MAG: hypothetical protein AAFN74_19790 [Myxococcota bacterium]